MALDWRINQSSWLEIWWRKPTDIVIDSKWQRGATLLQMTGAEWLIQASFTFFELPAKVSTIVNKIKEDAKENSSAKRIEIKRYQSYLKLIQIITRILLFYSKNQTPSFKLALKTLDAEPLKQKETFFAQEAEENLEDLLTKGDFRRLNA